MFTFFAHDSETAWRESVEEEVNRRLAERELIMKVQPASERASLLSCVGEPLKRNVGRQLRALP